MKNNFIHHFIEPPLSSWRAARVSCLHAVWGEVSE